jgi:tetratricopeptide (TPR) repeat protein
MQIPHQKANVDYYWGVAQYQRGHYDEALQHFDRFLQEAPTIWQSHYYIGLTKLRNREIEEAIDYFSMMPPSEYQSLLMTYIQDYQHLIEARTLFTTGNYEEACELYKSIKYFFGYKEIGRALCLAKLGDDSQSLVLLDSVIDYSTNKSVIGHSMFHAARLCLNLKKYEKARSYIENYLQIMTSDAALFLLGNIFSDQAKYDSAALYFVLLPDSVDTYLFYKGRTDFFRGQWGSAERQLLQHRELFPNSIHGDRTIYILASINFRRKEYHNAIVFWEELINRYPHSPYTASASKRVGDAYAIIKDYKNALNAYRSVKDYKPSSNIEEETTLKIYEMLYHLKRYPSLIYALRRFVSENPQSQLIPKTRLRIAKLLFGRKQYYQSLTELNNIIADYRDRSFVNEALIEKAHVCRTIGNVAEIKKTFHQLFENKQEKEYYSYAANELASIYVEETLYDSALYYYNVLMDFDKYREKAMLEIAKIYDKLGQHREAETMLDKLIEEFPTSVFLFDAYLLRSKAYKNQGNFEKAVGVLNELMSKGAAKPEIYIEIGHIYFELEDYTRAREHYLLACESFRQERDDAARALLLAGDASLALSETKQAIDYYLQANVIAKSLILKNQATEKISAISQE